MWNVALLMELFLSRDIRAIISIPTSISNKRIFLWHFDKRGVYTVKSAYYVSMDILGRAPNRLRGDVWACRNILPTKDNLRHRGGWM